MPTVTKPAKQPPNLLISTSLNSAEKNNFLEILGQAEVLDSAKKKIIAELQEALTEARNHMQTRKAWPFPHHIKASLKLLLKSAKGFESRLKQTIDNPHLRCALRNQGRRNIIDYIPILNRKGVHEDVLELIHQAERAIEETQKAGKGNGGQKQNRLKAAREKIKRDLETKIYDRYVTPEKRNEKKRRKDFWDACKSYLVSEVLQ